MEQKIKYSLLFNLNEFIFLHLAEEQILGIHFDSTWIVCAANLFTSLSKKKYVSKFSSF
jgi:hypothetical protein